MATLSEALGLVADVRERLERETAEMANRGSAQLIALDDAISRVRAERDRTRIAVEDERVRLERLGLDAARLDADHAAQARRAEQLARQIESQQFVIDVLEADLARARAAALEAATAHVQSRLRAGATRRERRAELERSRGEIARLSAAHAVAVAALEATPAEPPAAQDLVEIATRRARIVAEIASARHDRAAIAAPRDPASLADRVWQERAHSIDAEIARLERERAALDAAEDEARRAVAEHEALRASLRREIDAAGTRLHAAHRRFTLLDRSMEDEDARTARGVVAAEAASAEAAKHVRDLDGTLRAEREALGELRRRHAVVAASAAAAAERRDALRREIAEEARLRALMRELASLELGFTAAVAERDEFERLVGRMRAAAL